MKRAPIVLTGTALGLAGVLAYHTAAPDSSALTAGVSKTSARSTGPGNARAGHRPSAAARTTSTTTSATTTATRRARTTTRAPASRSAVGEDVSYPYGDLQIEVTERSGHITDVAVVRIDVPDAHSQSIDQSALPELRRQAISAQDAHIDGVSGASYTSQAYAASLQSALDRLA